MHRGSRCRLRCAHQLLRAGLLCGSCVLSSSRLLSGTRLLPGTCLLPGSRTGSGLLSSSGSLLQSLLPPTSSHHCAPSRLLLLK